MKVRFESINTIKKIITESKEEVTFYTFFYETKDLLKQLLSHPDSITLNPFWVHNGINKKRILNLLKRFRIIEVNVTLSDDAKTLVSYKIFKNNIKRNIRRLYLYLFEKDNEEPIVETDCSGCMGASGTYENSLGMVNKNISETTDTSAISNGTYETPFFLNKNNKTYRFAKNPAYLNGKILKDPLINGKQMNYDV